MDLRFGRRQIDDFFCSPNLKIGDGQKISFFCLSCVGHFFTLLFLLGTKSSSKSCDFFPPQKKSDDMFLFVTSFFKHFGNQIFLGSLNFPKLANDLFWLVRYFFRDLEIKILPAVKKWPKIIFCQHVEGQSNPSPPGSATGPYSCVREISQLFGGVFVHSRTSYSEYRGYQRPSPFT